MDSIRIPRICRSVRSNYVATLADALRMRTRPGNVRTEVVRMRTGLIHMRTNIVHVRQVRCECSRPPFACE